jgi:hypothetical protein
VGLRKLREAVVRPAFKIAPLPGYHMVRVGSGEYLVVNDADSTNNVIVDPQTVAGLLMDLATGGTPDEFRRGLGTMWGVEQVCE